MSLMEEIQNRVDKEQRTTKELYAIAKDNIMRMFFSGSMSKEQVVSVCSSLIKLYYNLNREQNNG